MEPEQNKTERQTLIEELEEVQQMLIWLRYKCRSGFIQKVNQDIEQYQCQFSILNELLGEEQE